MPNPFEYYDTVPCHKVWKTIKLSMKSSSVWAFLWHSKTSFTPNLSVDERWVTLTSVLRKLGIIGSQYFIHEESGYENFIQAAIGYGIIGPMGA
jgi:hypothetical protein